MGRMIEVQATETLPESVTLAVGDLLLFDATGGHIRSGEGAVELLGPFLPGTLLPSGEILSPMGSPNTLMVLARFPGRARIDVVTGDPWHESRSHTLQITVQS